MYHYQDNVQIHLNLFVQPIILQFEDHYKKSKLNVLL